MTQPFQLNYVRACVGVFGLPFQMNVVVFFIVVVSLSCIETDAVVPFSFGGARLTIVFESGHLFVAPNALT